MAEVMKETFGFQAEVKQLLQLMIHSLYSHKEIFLRELLSNASDAADKLRFEALADPYLLVNDPELKVWIEFDKAAWTITLRDNGIGMSREELIQNLGTLAKSGTRDYLKTLSAEKAKNANLIGQFGVGFYSVFMVADKVEVTSRKATSTPDQGCRWVSSGDGEFTIETLNVEARGTEITLHLKKEEEEFLNYLRLKTIVTKYADHLTLPVMMKNDQGVEELVNRATALWTLPKQEITETQYQELYKHLAHDFEDSLLWTHNKVEGKLEYIALLYIPSRAPFDLWQAGKPRGLKLYVKRVFILDDAEQFLPHYLRFVRGIIDSNDLPLNVSRETLQTNRIIDSMRSYVVKRVLSMLSGLAEESPQKYQLFWKEFGQALKEGLVEDFANKQDIAELLRWRSTHLEQDQETVSFKDYVARMQPQQNKIYYLTAESFAAAEHSPHLEIFRKKGIEVLLLCDRIDEWLMMHFTEYQGKPLQSIARGNLELEAFNSEDGDATEQPLSETAVAEYQTMIDKMKEILKDDVKDIRISERLTHSPSCIVADDQDLSLQMEKLLRLSGQKVPESKPILELNPHHLLVQRLKQAAENSNQQFEDLSHLLLGQAILAEGGRLSDPANFVKRVTQLLVEKL